MEWYLGKDKDNFTFTFTFTSVKNAWSYIATLHCMTISYNFPGFYIDFIIYRTFLYSTLNQ